jgi:hypothetical protein
MKGLDVRNQIIGIVAIALLLAGCSGGGGVAPAAKGPITTAPSSAQRVALNFEIDDTKPSSHSRAPQFVSGGTNILGIKVGSSAEIYYNVSVGSPNCNALTPRVCTVFVNAAPGSNSFLFQTFNDTVASPTMTFTVSTTPTILLAEGSLTQTITAGTSNTLNVTLNGTPASVVFGPLHSFPGDGSPHSQALTVAVNDAAGFTISGTYDTPVTLVLTEAPPLAGFTSLSTTTLASSTTASVNVNYTGGGSGAYHATITDNIAADSANSVVFAPLFVDQATLNLAITTQSTGNAVGTSGIVSPSEFNLSMFTWTSTCDGTPPRASASVSPASPGSPPFTVTATGAGTACAVTFSDGTSSISTSVNVTSTSAVITI